jgi:hypothetical protein
MENDSLILLLGRRHQEFYYLTLKEHRMSLLRSLVVCESTYFIELFRLALGRCQLGALFYGLFRLEMDV